VLQAKQNVCVHNLSFSTLIFNPQAAVDFCRYNDCGKEDRFDLEVVFKNSAIKAIVEDIESKSYGKREEVTQLWVKEGD
jgi:hypothetical protein